MADEAEGDFADFYAATWPRTLAVVYALTGDRGTAEEVAQEAYVKAWSHWARVSRYDQPAAWVRQVATRLSVSRWRRSRVAAAWLARNRTESTAPPPGGSTTTYDVDGVQVRHDSMPPDPESDADMWLGDIWSVRIGADRAQLELVNDSGVADDATAEEVAEALVAGLRDGWTQSGMEDVSPVQPSNGEGGFPDWSDVDLEGALAGWGSPTRRAPAPSPNLRCLHDRLDGPPTSISAGGGSRWGLSHRAASYDDPTGGTANVELVLDELRACTTTDVRVETLANGVHLATFDTGGLEGRGAIWLAANEDRAGLVAVERADRPMPMGVREDVADALYEWLRLPWG